MAGKGDVAAKDFRKFDGLVRRVALFLLELSLKMNDIGSVAVGQKRPHSRQGGTATAAPKRHKATRGVRFQTDTTDIHARVDQSIDGHEEREEEDAEYADEVARLTKHRQRRHRAVQFIADDSDEEEKSLQDGSEGSRNTRKLKSGDKLGRANDIDRSEVRTALQHQEMDPRERDMEVVEGSAVPLEPFNMRREEDEGYVVFSGLFPVQRS